MFKSVPAYNVSSATPLSAATAWRACVPQPQLVRKMLQLGCVGTLLWSSICEKASTTSVWHGHHLKAHVEISATGHPEHPDRTRELLSALKEEQLLSRCYKLPSRAVSILPLAARQQLLKLTIRDMPQATNEEIHRVHRPEYADQVGVGPWLVHTAAGSC